MGATYTCRGALSEEARGRVTTLLAAGEQAKARIVDDSSRTRCGASLDEVIAEIPEDGQEHQVVCPECAQTVTVRRVPTEGPAEEEIDQQD